MKIRLTARYALLCACSLISSLFAGAASAQTVDIAPMTWNLSRSDWVNIKTDPALAVHAVGDGVVDDTAAIQGALNLTGSSVYTGKKTVYIPAGTYKITTTLTWNAQGAAIIGCGRDTILKWYGAPGVPMYWSQGTSHTRYIGLAWDGNNLAACGVLHKSTLPYETGVRHENESFKNFVVSGTYSSGQTLPASGIMGGISGEVNPTAEVMIWNCLFYKCTVGAMVGYQLYNNYMWLFDGCEFENCGTGIGGYDGKFTSTNCHFAGSTVTDIFGGATSRVRHCTSVGSAGFLLEGGPSGGTCSGVIQDCWVDGWTGNQGALRFGLRGPDNVFDCVFTHPPVGATAPIYLMNNAVNLIESNNYAPGLANLTFGYTSPSLVHVPCGSLPGSITSPQQKFLNSTPQADSAYVLDITKPPYNVIVGGTGNATAAIQQAINDVKAANNGSIVYFPLNTYGYKVSSTLNVSGSNYTLQGSGFGCVLLWTGGSNSTMMSVTTPQNISIEQLELIGATNMITQTSTGPSSITYDGISGFRNGYIGTLTLSSLPAGSVVYMGEVACSLAVNDCGPAQIYAKFLGFNQITVQGATKAKTGFLGAAIAEGGQQQNTGAYNINVFDNQDLVLGDYYDEQTYNDLNLQRGSATWTGKVTIQGFKEQANAPSTQINVNNYAGRLMYGPQGFTNSGTSAVITHSGLNPFDLILPGEVFINGTPRITTGAGCNLIEAANLSVLSGSTTIMPNFPNPLTSANLVSMAAGLDHLRQLGAVGLFMDYGLFQDVTNPTFETDSANPSPLTTMGYNPAGWSLTGTYSAPAGVRNVTVVSAGSPFGTGGQSANFVDTTGTAVGYRLDFNQFVPALPASAGAVLSFDLRLPTMTSLFDDIWIRVFTVDNAVPFAVHLGATNTFASIGPAPLTLDKWYRIRAVIPAPNTPGAATVTLYVTPWAGTVPGTTLTYTVPGLTAPAATGFSRILFNSMGPGTRINVNLDNIALQNGTFAFPSLP